jgi:hypothetical protein
MSRCPNKNVDCVDTGLEEGWGLTGPEGRGMSGVAGAVLRLSLPTLITIKYRPSAPWLSSWTLHFYKMWKILVASAM